MAKLRLASSMLIYFKLANQGTWPPLLYNISILYDIGKQSQMVTQKFLHHTHSHTGELIGTKTSKKKHTN